MDHPALPRGDFLTATRPIGIEDPRIAIRVHRQAHHIIVTDMVRIVNTLSCDCAELESKRDTNFWT
jgi:hypothetical protein